MNPGQQIPCTILTGFLGSGKTTLLNQLLKDAAFGQAAIIVNEFGEIAIDNELIVHATDRMVVLAGGCICCATREDVEEALRVLFQQRDAGQIPAFDRVVIETTGLADPVPLLMTLRSFGLARERLQPPVVVTTVDAALHRATFARYPQAVRQVTAAHLLVVTKGDQLEAQAVKAIAADLEAMNPWAQVEMPRSGEDAGMLLARYLTRDEARADDAWLPDRLLSGAFEPGAWSGGRYVQRGGHGLSVRSFPVVLDQEVDWTALGIWMTLLLHRHGANVLRIKGLLHVKGLRGPVVVHSAQHMVHAPVHLEAWPSEDRRSRLVFIVDGLDPEAVIRSLKAFMVLAQTERVGGIESHSAPAGAGGTVRGRPIRRPTAPRWIRG